MGLYDRDYMGGDYRGGGSLKRAFAGWSAVKFLIVLNVVSFVAGAFADKAFGFGAYYQLFELSWQNLAQGKIWTVLTYSLLHANLLHIVLNMIGLYFIGTPLERIIGAKKFFAVYLFGAFFGAFAWLATSVGDTAGLVGASASVMAVFAAFCFFYPPVPITFLIFFVLPVSMRPMTMLKIAAVFEALGLAYSLSGGDAAIAYAAHLGGMAAGALFAVSFQRGLLGFLDKIAAPNFSLKGKRGNRANVETYSYRVNITDPVELKREVDRILDKIDASGFASLTEVERESLRRAKSYLK